MSTHTTSNQNVLEGSQGQAPDPVAVRQSDGRIEIDWRTPDGVMMPGGWIRMSVELLAHLIAEHNEHVTEHPGLRGTA